MLFVKSKNVLVIVCFRIKGKINAPPKDPDDQPVPKSLTQLFAFENKIKEKGINLKKKKKQYSNGNKDYNNNIRLLVITSNIKLDKVLFSQR